MSPDARAPGFDGAATPFLGREHELSQLGAALDAVGAGSGGVVLIGGEPGIGKTRLAAVLAGEATARAIPVWWGHCWEDGTAPVFWPWNAALRRWIRRAGDEAVLAAAGRHSAELAHVFPILRERLPDLASAPQWQSDTARFRLFDSVSRFLGEIARPAGLVVVLDDVQWADGPSLKLLEFIVADVVQARVLLVLTYRDTEVRRGHPLFATLSIMAREPSMRRLLLAGLPASDCARYLTMMGGASAADALGAELHRETNGNPFFLGEIVRLLVSEGQLETTWDRRIVPPGVREVVSRRLDRLGAGCRSTLVVGALLGDSFEVARVENILGAPPAAGDPTVANVLEHAVRDRILVRISVRPLRYAFAHALIRRAVIDELDALERATWHARIATAIEREAGSRVDAVAGELVRHFAAAGTVDWLRKAYTYACRGAEQAAAQLGWEEAARLYEIALEFGTRCQALDDTQTLELRLAQARALRRSGDVVGARARCREVAAACREAPRPDLLAHAALVHAGPLPEFGWVDADARAILEQACRAGSPLDDALRARLYARLAADIIAANEIDQVTRAVTLGQEAALAAGRAGDSGALAQALMVGFYATALGMPPASSGERTSVAAMVPQLRELLRQILDAAESAAEVEFAAEIRLTRAAAMLAFGEVEGYWAEHDALVAVAVSSRVPEALWLAEAVSAMRATVEGRFAEGRRLSDQALATGLRMQLTNATAVHLGQQIVWYGLQGRLGEFLPVLSDFMERHPRIAFWRPFLALARLASGDEIGARAEFRTLLAAGLSPAQRGVNVRAYLAGLALLCVGLRDRGQAPLLYDLVAQRGETWAVDGCSTFGPWTVALGSLARLSGRPEDAATHFAEAIRVARHLRARPIVAHAQSLLASVWLSSELDSATRARVVAALDEAEQTARELGIVDVLARTQRLRAKLTLPVRSAAPANTIRREGDFWTVRYGGTELLLKDGKGIRYLATLLAAPRREFHVMQLATAGRGTSSRPAAMPDLSIGGPGRTLDEAPDARARREYRARLEDLRVELEEAEQLNDLGRAERLRAELEQISLEIAGRFRGRGRPRGPAETARKAVTKALRAQIGRLLEEHPALGRHLRDAIRMGTVCVYLPAATIDWET